MVDLIIAVVGGERNKPHGKFLFEFYPLPPLPSNKRNSARLKSLEHHLSSSFPACSPEASAALARTRCAGWSKLWLPQPSKEPCQASCAGAGGSSGAGQPARSCSPGTWPPCFARSGGIAALEALPSGEGQVCLSEAVLVQQRQRSWTARLSQRRLLCTCRREVNSFAAKKPPKQFPGHNSKGLSIVRNAVCQWWVRHAC